MFQAGELPRDPLCCAQMRRGSWKPTAVGAWGGTDGVSRHGGGARTTSSPQVQGGGSLGKAQAHHPHPVSSLVCPEQPPAPFLLDWPQENVSTVRVMLNGR